MTSRVAKQLLHWDFLLSLGLALVIAFPMVMSDRPLEGDTPYFLAAIALGGALLVATGVVTRNLSDVLHGGKYGELVRALTNKDEQRAVAPHRIVQAACVGVMVGGVLLVVTRGELGRTPTAIAYSLEAFLVLYSIFGLYDVFRIDARHRARRARIEGTREDEARRKRTQE
jgi:hypothetical protein